MQERIDALRAKMAENGIDAYIIPSSDPHQSEYVADRWKARAWITGFTGSAGTAIVSGDHAGLWTDSRYFIQAEKQLKNSGFALHKLLIPHTPEHLEWLANTLPQGSTVGFDGHLLSADQVDRIREAFADKGFKLEYQTDLVGTVWTDRPAAPKNPVFDFPESFTGKSRTDKLSEVREAMQAAGASHYLLSTLDDIAWLFNLRGRDVECNPVFIAHAVIEAEKATLFTDREKFSQQLVNELASAGVEIQAYERIAGFLADPGKKAKVLFDPATTSIALRDTLPETNRLPGDNLVAPHKTLKNETEIGHLRKAMEKDGVALLRLFRWLERTLEREGEVSEVAVAQKLAGFREEQGNYYGESFDAIVGYEANGAIVHYRAEPGSCAQIKKEGILLLDSGGQYLEGTTDITRTIALGTPRLDQKIDYTLVLKGNLALSMARFPKGTNGLQLDVLARQFLWRADRNYGHGTGHGVGFFLNVHEGPQGISPVLSGRTKKTFQAGMLTSNEPGIYREGQYGIRIENLVLCRQATTNAFGEFLEFETVTLFPIDTQLIEKSMLNPAEIAWLNSYHADVWKRLSPYLGADEREWLEAKCQPL